MLEKYPADLSRLKYFQVNFPSKHIAEMVIEECAAIGIPEDTLYSKMSSMGYAGPPMVFICLDKCFVKKHSSGRSGAKLCN